MYNRHFRAPLTFESQRFSRAYKTSKKFHVPEKIVAVVLKALYIFLLLAINLVLFTGSGNVSIFQEGFAFVSELSYLFGLLFFVSVILMAVSYFSVLLQNILCSVITFVFIVVLFNQFSQFDHGAFMGDFFAEYLGAWTPRLLFEASHVVLAFVLSLALMWFLFKVGNIALGIYVSLYFIAFAGILRNDFNQSHNQHDFIELYQSKIKANVDTDGQKFIYVMLPNLTSSKFFAVLQDSEADETQKIINGFYAHNKFNVFPNAYNNSENPFMNMASVLNPFSKQNAVNHTMNTMLLYKYWKFFNVNDEYIFLKNNQLFDAFRKSGYKISAYKSRGFDLCQKKHMFNVDRCTEKLNKPINLYSLSISKTERAQLLFIEWISSMGIFNNLSGAYKALKIFSEPETLPLVGVNYNNLYVINSVKTFDILLENMVNDTGRQAYFVYADIPSDMFIYDQFCRIKPRHEWINMKKLPWVNFDNTDLKKHAYLQQSKCLYGKLQQFIEKLEQKNLADKTVLVINGMSGVKNFKPNGEQNFVDDMIYDKIVMLAVKSPKQKKFEINTQICSSPELLSNYLFKGADCNDLEQLNIHQTLKNELAAKLAEYDSSEEQINESINTFQEWYLKWLEANKYEAGNVDVVKHNRPSKTLRHMPIKVTPAIDNESLINN